MASSSMCGSDNRAAIWRARVVFPAPDVPVTKIRILAEVCPLRSVGRMGLDRARLIALARLPDSPPNKHHRNLALHLPAA
jgi:hypothetical protein